MDWDGLQVFLAVARTGRLSAAARRLGVEHSTVSRRLAALEEVLGVRLFYRTADGYTPTQHGANVLSSAEAMEVAALAVASRAREQDSVASGQVRIDMPPEFASHWLAPHLAAFRTAHPQIELQVLVGTRLRNLWRGEAELAIQSPRPTQKGLIAVRIGRTTTALFAARSLVNRAKPPLRAPDALRDLPILSFTASFDLLQDAKWFQEFRRKSRAPLTTNSTHLLLEAARHGAGIAVLPRLVARHYDDLVEVSETLAERDVWLITHPEFRRDPKVKATADFVRRIAAEPNGLC